MRPLQTSGGRCARDQIRPGSREGSMNRCRRAPRFLVVTLGVLAAAPIVMSARPADALFRYFSRKNLAHELEADPEKWIDKDVVVTDEICYVWPENAETDTADGTKYVRFDTTYFRCAIDASKDHKYVDGLWEDAKNCCKDLLAKIEDVNEQQRTRKKSETDAAKERRELCDQ